MKIEIITTYYREEFLAPLFFLHYETWADRITVLTERFPDNKTDDVLKMDLINGAVSRSVADWVVVVDFDEFVYPMPIGRDPRKTLEEEKGDIIQCKMLRVWRHNTDGDINLSQPPLPQRRHGNGVHDHTKPCIFRPKGVSTGIGCHNVTVPGHYGWGQEWQAVHWANADPIFGIQRTRRDRLNRMSQRNLSNGWGFLPQWMEGNHLENLYNSHRNDPLIINL
jgi:hypothetical protein